MGSLVAASTLQRPVERGDYSDAGPRDKLSGMTQLTTPCPVRP
jgi:hypothetical protein